MIASGQVNGYALMELAGASLLSRLRGLAPANGRVVIVCGAGNNAGDGYVLARLAEREGYVVRVLALKNPNDLSGDARTAAIEWHEAGGQTEPMDPGNFVNAGQAADLVVDALLGSGIQRAVEGEFKKVIDGINELKAPVLSVDVPSGLDADTGTPLGVAVNSNGDCHLCRPEKGPANRSGTGFHGLYDICQSRCRTV